MLRYDEVCSVWIAAGLLILGYWSDFSYSEVVEEVRVADWRDRCGGDQRGFCLDGGVLSGSAEAGLGEDEPERYVLPMSRACSVLGLLLCSLRRRDSSRPPFRMHRSETDRHGLVAMSKTEGEVVGHEYVYGDWDGDGRVVC